MTLNHKLTFQYHVNEKIKKKKERNWSSSKTTAYFTLNIFTDYLQIAYKTNAFSSKLETVQYNVALAIMRAIKGTSLEKLYQELGLEYLQQRR